ncbi:MAG: hypothetical protein CSA49_01305 [Gammaproteobacteria bacterium]|nr:MAG: hypothetical protein CSA49_01305 [Gammaproteobacteria bacterium]
MKLNKYMTLAAAALITVTLSGCSKLTKENYQLLEVGMDMPDVEAIIGEPTSCEETLGVQACTWGDETKNIKIKLVADKVVLLSHKGLQ